MPLITRFIYPLSLRARISYKLYRFFKNLNDKNISLQFADHVKLDVSKTDFGHKSIIFNGFYELKLTRQLVQQAKKGGVMVDVGANYGYYTCLWAAQNPNNKVIAFEASPPNVAPLINNVTKNGLNSQVTVLPMAAGKEKGEMKFSLGGHADQTGWGGFTIMDDDGADVVPVDTLDAYSEKYNIDKIDLLKIDTEGADTWVLYGAERLLREKRIAHIYYEHNVSRMQLLNINEDDSINFLHNCDYTVVRQSANDYYAYPK